MKQIVTSALYLLTIVAVSHFIFEPAYLYYELKWLDIPMHIMGGFGIASLVSAVFSYAGRPVSFWHLFMLYAAAAVSWELYEYMQDMAAGTDWNGWVDTIKDFIDGAIGVGLAYLFIRK
jgi:hypothetical protein